jgi:hypothetical protein
MSGQLHGLAALSTGKEPWYPLGKRLFGPQSRSGRCGVERKLALLGIEPRPSTPQPVATPTELGTEYVVKCGSFETYPSQPLSGISDLIRARNNGGH